MIILMMLVTMPFVVADMCEDEIEIITNCTMLTPSLDCGSYTYSIYNLTGNLEVFNESLTYLNSSIYYINFTLGIGDYIVELCDGTTREVRVGALEDYTMLSIIFGLVAMIAFLMFFGSKVNNPAIKWVAYVLSGVEAIIMIGGVYGISISADFSLLLYINMVAFIFVFLGLLTWSLAAKNIDMATGTEEQDNGFADDQSWKKGWDKNGQ